MTDKHPDLLERIRLRLDDTLVDVTGIVIDFEVAARVLRGTLL